MSERRAQGLVRIARRIEELPRCWALFEAGRITEDLMVQLARRLPAERDEEMAQQVPSLLVSQLRRILATCPELPDGRSQGLAPPPAPALRELLHPPRWLAQR